CEFLSHRVNLLRRNLVAKVSSTGRCIASWIANCRTWVIDWPRPIRKITRPFLGRRNLYRILRWGRVLPPAVVGEEPERLISSVVEARNAKWAADCTAKLVLLKWCNLRHRSVKVGILVLLQRAFGIERVVLNVVVRLPVQLVRARFDSQIDLAGALPVFGGVKARLHLKFLDGKFWGDARRSREEVVGIGDPIH